MPLQVGRACPTPRCPVIVLRDRPCPTHGSKARRREYDETRASSSARGYDSRWERARKAYLQAHPLCAYAERHGRVELATVVDHVVPHRGARALAIGPRLRAKELFWDAENWQPLTAAAHAAKTLRENGLAPCTEHGQGTATVRGALVCRDCGGAA